MVPEILQGEIELVMALFKIGKQFDGMKPAERLKGKIEQQCITVHQTYISGSFCVSITAAKGIPKLETGPQKSVVKRH